MVRRGRPGWRLKLLAGWTVLFILLTVWPLPPARAQGTAAPPQPDGLRVLQHYGVVLGDRFGNLRLGDRITRAEMAVILVRAVGQDEQAQFIVGRDPFHDINRHWARGHIALASQLNLIRGYPDGSFQPKRDVTYAEALSMILRVVGREPAGGPWPDAVFDEAERLGIVPPSLASVRAAAQQPAIRLHVFTFLYYAMSKIPAGADGKTLLQQLDTNPPRLTVNPLPTYVDRGLVTVSGTVSDAVWVRVNGVYLPGDVGRFEQQVPVSPGANTIEVEAADLADNRTKTTFTVIWGEPLARIAVEGPDRIPAGEAATYTVTGYGVSGTPMPVHGLTVRVEGNIGRFEQETMRFIASREPGSGRLIFSAQGVETAVPIYVLGPSPNAAQVAIAEVAGGGPMVAGTETEVVVQVLDRRGQPVEEDTGRPVTLSVPDVYNATVTPAIAYTRFGKATFRVKVPVQGTFTFVARSDRLREGRSQVTVWPPVRVQLVVEPQPLVADGYSKAQIVARLVDPWGNPVPNPDDRDVVVELSQTGVEATLLDKVLRIPPGASTSPRAGELVAGRKSGKLTIGGEVASHHPYKVDRAEVTVVSPIRGLPMGIQIIGPKGITKVGQPATFTLQVVDGFGQPVPDGRFAFRLRVRAEHDEGSNDRLPEGITVRVGPIDLDPAFGLTARTYKGKATITVTSDRSGVVTVEPILLPPVSDGAYDDQGVAGAADGTLGLRVTGAQATFAGQPVALKAEVDSIIGAKAKHGALAANRSSTAVIRVIVVDEKGARVPGVRQKVTLVRESGSATLPPSQMERETVDGVAEFVIRAGTATSTDGQPDTYKAEDKTGKLQPSDPVHLTVHDTPPPAPRILGIRGVKEEVPRQLNLVAADDTHMELDIGMGPGQAAPGVVAVAVYVEGQSQPIYRSPPVDLTGGQVLIRVPKEKLPVGAFRYQVTLINGVGESARSTLSPVVLNENYLPVAVTRARFDSATQRLILVGSGFNRTGGLVRTDRIRLRVSDQATIPLEDAVVTINSSTQISLQLDESIQNHALALGWLKTVTDQDLSQPAKTYLHPRDIYLELDTGWYGVNTGPAARAVSRLPIHPLGTVAAAHLDLKNKVLEIRGLGLESGTLKPARLRILNTANGAVVSLSGLTARQLGDEQWNITLSGTALAALSDPNNFTGPGVVLLTEPGWLEDSGALAAELPPRPVYWAVKLTRAEFRADTSTLVLMGSGFSGGTLDLTKLRVVDLNEVQDPNDDLQLPLAGATITEARDDRFTITLTQTQVDTLLNGPFAGEDVYLVMDAGWFTVDGWPAGPIPEGVLRMVLP